MTTRYVLQVTLLEDLHTGTGTGGGGIDSVQAIDREGRPVIRGTHVRGVLREAANEYVRLAAKTLPDEHDKQIELRDQVIRLFGSESSRDDSPAGRNAPSRGALFVGSLRLKPSKDGTGDGFILWSSTARGRIERTTGDEPNSVRQEPLDRIPLEDTLRTVEFIPAGKCFEGEVSLLDERLKPLLDVCVKRVQCLGSSRTRGAGLVRMTLQPQPPGRCHIM
ncbi:MAG: hypothetical protein FJY85_02980, partial [Deltaproteobacteria bacterium]|nr:hypothetical protein [Deltaproteobacteria bacterium]